MFSIDSITGIISNTNSLDCELLGREIILEVIAYDLADNFSSLPAKVIVNIEDINDHAPEIIHDIASHDSDKFECLSGVNGMNTKVYPIFLKEAANTFRNQTVFISFSVTDKDNNDNAVSCQTVQSNIKSGFRLENVNDNVYQLCFPCFSESVKDFESSSMNLFDREMQDCHFVVISCSDTDDKISFTSDVTFVISLEDINDNKPELEFQRYHFTIASRALCDGKVIGQFKGFDPDEDDNGKLHVFVENCARVDFKNYSHSVETSMAPKLNVNDGILRLVTFEETMLCEESYNGLHECTIKVEDFGLPKLSSSSSVYIFIDPSHTIHLDRTSQKQYSMFIRENQPRHTFIGNIRSYLNVNASLPLKVLSSDNTDIDFDPLTGSISTLISLDYELKNVYKLSILMTGKNNSSNSEINVTIHVLDENDNPPIILYPLDNDIIKVFKMSHAASLHVCNIVAIDHDDGANGEIEFHIVHNESSKDLELVPELNFDLSSFKKCIYSNVIIIIMWIMCLLITDNKS